MYDLDRIISSIPEEVIEEKRREILKWRNGVLFFDDYLNKGEGERTFDALDRLMNVLRRKKKGIKIGNLEFI